MQEFYDWVLSGFCAVLGFLLNAVWQAVKDLQRADNEQTKRESEIEVLVAGNYVTKHEFDRVVQRLFAKLDSIDSKLDSKVDK